MRLLPVVLLVMGALPRGLFPQAAPDLRALERQAEALVKTNPTGENWQKLGLTRFVQNRFAEALPAFEAAVGRAPGLWTAHLFLGISRYRTNRFAEALGALETAKRLAPSGQRGTDDVDFWLGASFIAVKRPWEGLAALEELLARNPQHTDALAMSARTHAELGGSLWNEIAEQHFDTAQGQEVHGHVLEGEGNRAGAIEAYRAAQRKDPERPGPAEALARLSQAGETP